MPLPEKKEEKRTFKPSDFPTMPRVLRLQLIKVLNKGEPSRKLTAEERKALDAERVAGVLA